MYVSGRKVCKSVASTMPLTQTALHTSKNKEGGVKVASTQNILLLYTSPHNLYTLYVTIESHFEGSKVKGQGHGSR